MKIITLPRTLRFASTLRCSHIVDLANGAKTACSRPTDITSRSFSRALPLFNVCQTCVRVVGHRCTIEERVA